MATRTPEEIRASIEANRQELGTSIERLNQQIVVAKDWRRHLRANKRGVVVGAAVAGFVLGGGVAGVVGLFRR